MYIARVFKGGKGANASAKEQKQEDTEPICNTVLTIVRMLVQRDTCSDQRATMIS